ncbi:SapB/AmfS family lanthipeptide [Streptomyces sp. NPDC057654]
MSIHDLQGLKPPEESEERMDSEASWWSCGDHRPSHISLFACG